MDPLAMQSPFRRDALDRVQRLGFRAIQLRLGPEFPIDTRAADPEEVREAAEELARRGLDVVALGYYRNHLEPEPEGRAEDELGLRNVLRMARSFGADRIGVFCGRDPEGSLEENLAEVERVWPPIVAEAASLGLRIAFENCTMFRGDPLRSINLCHTPRAYRRLFEILPSSTVGIELDPSHLVKQRIDPIRFVEEFGPRILHVHAKDHEHLPDALQTFGSYDPRCSRDRLPGAGEVDWPALAAALRGVRYRGPVTLEVERGPDGRDPSEDEIGAARDVLRHCGFGAGAD